MFKGIRLENMFKSGSAAGLEATVMPDGNYRYRLIVLKRKQSALNTELQCREVSSLAEIKNQLEPKIPLVIILDGKGVVYRKVYGKENESPAALLNKLLPNANADEFVIQRTALNESEILIAVIRLTVLTGFINELIAHELTAVTGCFIGPVVLNSILPLLDTQVVNGGYLQVDTFGLKIQEQQITDIELLTASADEEIRIGNDTISKQLLIPFAGALSCFTGYENDISNAGVLDQLKNEWKQKQTFETRGWALLVTVFLILMVNYLVFNNYWSRNKEMTLQLQLAQTSLQRYEKLKQEFGQKKQFLEENGLLENSRTSYYADALAKDLPASIQFTGLNIHPLKKKKPAEENNVLTFENKLIHVSGNCRQNTELNEWMKKMKKKDWVNDLVLLNYRQDNLEENGVFLIEIKLN